MTSHAKELARRDAKRQERRLPEDIVRHMNRADLRAVMFMDCSAMSMKWPGVPCRDIWAAADARLVAEKPKRRAR